MRIFTLGIKFTTCMIHLLSLKNQYFVLFTVISDRLNCIGYSKVKIILLKDETLTTLMHLKTLLCLFSHFKFIGDSKLRVSTVPNIMRVIPLSFVVVFDLLLHCVLHNDIMSIKRMKLKLFCQPLIIRSSLYNINIYQPVNLDNVNGNKTKTKISDW